jgi:hypothetical protein
MAKKQRTNQVTASFHYIVKRKRGEPDSEETGFTPDEFAKLAARLGDTSPIDFNDEAAIQLIKQGDIIPLLKVTDISSTRIFGQFEGAYYGQEYRNTKVGTIDADSLNLRTFHYVVEHRRDGRIVIGTRYLGNYGDYDGLYKFISKVLQSNEFVVRSKSFTSLRHELGSGTPVELKVTLNRPGKKLGSRSLFSSTGIFAVRSAEYGEDFEKDVKGLVPHVKGSLEARKAALASIMSQGDLMDIDDEDIAGCTVLMRQDGHQYTVYLLGDSNVSTKFPLSVHVPSNGLLDYNSVQREITRVLDDIITPGLRQ